MALDLTSFDKALKEHYTNDRVENMVYADNPLLAMMPKMESFGGRNLPIPTIWGNPQGRSATFTQAQARGLVTNSQIAAFLLTRVKDYSLANIDNETLEASKGDSNAFMEAATVEIDGAINSLTRSLAIAQYRSGLGDIGQIGAIAGAVLTLSNVEDITNFEVGQELTVAAAQNGAERAGSVVITGIDRVLGTLTFAANVVAGIAAAVAGDFIFIKGDHNIAELKKIAGLEAWIPTTAPGAALFFNTNRSQDVTRLGGLRKDISALTIEEGLIDGASLVSREGGKLSHFFMNYGKYAQLEKGLGTKVQYVDMKVSAEISFRGVLVNGPKGVIRVVPDQNCQSDKVWGLTMSVWKHYSLGKACRVIDTDGLQMLRQSNADGVEVRYGYYANTGCRAPGHNINLKV